MAAAWGPLGGQRRGLGFIQSQPLETTTQHYCSSAAIFSSRRRGRSYLHLFVGFSMPATPTGLESQQEAVNSRARVELGHGPHPDSKTKRFEHTVQLLLLLLRHLANYSFGAAVEHARACPERSPGALLSAQPFTVQSRSGTVGFAAAATPGCALSETRLPRSPRFGRHWLLVTLALLAAPTPCHSL